MTRTLLTCLAVAMVSAAGSFASEGRVTVPLDGPWSIADSASADDMPARFDHTVAVPGLAHSAQPAFPDVDHYETHEFVWTMKRYHVLPDSDKCDGLGRTRQTRNYFWYERTFTVPVKRQSAVLVIDRAQFGMAVWLNGKKLGQSLACFTAGRFDATGAIDWTGPNRLVVRIGAHPGVLPEEALYGTDGEKAAWTPGIYDSVSLHLADNPRIDSLQVAPRIATSEVLVQTRIKNPGRAGSFQMTWQVTTWKGNQAVGTPVRKQIELAAGEEKVVMQTVPVPGAVLWCPEQPFLYALSVSTGGDSATTRFGMREFRCDGVTRRAMLNGKVIYLRGSSITLHRFFGDPKSAGLPWDEAWVRKLLVDVPRQMHWNSFRICIGPAPQRWLDIADEAGLLLQYEFPIWSDRPCRGDGSFRHKLWKEDQVTEQVRQFMEDNWNHPSVALWDASNETHWLFLKDKLIPALRGLDLSGRPWENGYNPPQSADDPAEDHPYLFIDHCFAPKPPFFQMTDIESMQGWKKGTPAFLATHAAIINEYDWLWLHRDGTPTELTKKVYDHLLGPNASARERRELCAYLLAGTTEHWRAWRKYAGVMYLAYLDADLPHAFTCDNFRDVETLELDPYFIDYVREAFKPLGVYVHFWQPTLPAGHERVYRVMLVNDTHRPVQGRLELVWQQEDGRGQSPRTTGGFAMQALGQQTCELTLAAPQTPGKYRLVAKAFGLGEGQPESPTISRRKVQIVPSAAKP